MADPIKNYPSMGITTEHHSVGTVKGLPGSANPGMSAEYIEIPSGGTTGPKVPEFPSKNA